MTTCTVHSGKPFGYLSTLMAAKLPSGRLGPAQQHSIPYNYKYVAVMNGLNGRSLSGRLATLLAGTTVR
jgi:hypothetical protein